MSALLEFTSLREARTSPIIPGSGLAPAGTAHADDAEFVVGLGNLELTSGEASTFAECRATKGSPSPITIIAITKKVTIGVAKLNGELRPALFGHYGRCHRFNDRRVTTTALFGGMTVIVIVDGEQKAAMSIEIPNTAIDPKLLTPGDKSEKGKTASKTWPKHPSQSHCEPISIVLRANEWSIDHQCRKNSAPG